MAETKRFKGIRMPGMSDFYVVPEAVAIEDENGFVEIQSYISDTIEIENLDTTLTKNGYAADAAAVGAKFDRFYVTAGQSEDSPIGTSATAEGNWTNAAGDCSHAEGDETHAIGYGSHAEGYNSVAHGDYSHAEGASGTMAEYAHAEGLDAMAVGHHSHAEGNSTTSAGQGSHAEGNCTNAMGDYSHAEGYNAKLYSDDSLKLTGAAETTSYTYTENTFTPSVGKYILCYFDGKAASAKITAVDTSTSTITVNQTLSSTALSAATAYRVTSGALGDYAHAEGEGTIAAGQAQHVQGRHNIEDTSDIYAHIVGNGDSTTRSNAHTLDWDGNAWFAGAIDCEDTATTLTNLGAAPAGYGIGSSSKSVGDANDALVGGVYYYGSDASNIPDGFGAGVIFVQNRADAQIFQRISDIYGLVAERIRQSNGTWGDWIDVSPSAFAPAGYGLGTVRPPKTVTLSELDGLYETGWYWLSAVGTTLNGVYFNYASVFVHGMEEGACVQEIHPLAKNCVLTRYAYKGTFEPWECPNPPMNLGVEYRTTARLNNKVMYKRMTSAGIVEYRLDGETTWKNYAGLLGQTDYVVANGTSGVWSYWKFNSGLCIAMGQPTVTWGTQTQVITGQYRSGTALDLTGIFTAVMGGTCSNVHRYVNCFVIPSGSTSAELWATTAALANAELYSKTPMVVLFGKWK